MCSYTHVGSNVLTLETNLFYIKLLIYPTLLL
jgi:hypothetical protein